LKFLFKIWALITPFLLVSCEKVINVDLAGSAEAIVIEATLSTEKQPVRVLISKTSPYFGAKAGNPVSGASVSIRSEKGDPHYLTESEPGVYTLGKTWASPGYWYVVDVEYDGVTYTARSFLNDMVPIVDLGFSYFDGMGFFGNGYTVACYIRDPGDAENYYRLKYYVNGKPIDDKGEISLYSDKLFNGKDIGIGQRLLVFQETDTLTVELLSIDKAAYDYFSTLENITATDWQQSAAPANPISNFNHGALGYFSAYSVARKTVVVKDYLKK
jgi:hypothetical protein